MNKFFLGCFALIFALSAVASLQTAQAQTGNELGGVSAPGGPPVGLEDSSVSEESTDELEDTNTSEGPVGPEAPDALPASVPSTIDPSYSTGDAVSSSESFSDSQSSTDGSPVFVSSGASPEELMVVIERLRTQIAALQEQIRQTRGEISQILQSGLSQGMQNEDVRQIQELLATNPAIYPEGLVTGYFGPLTEGAIQRFQGSHSLSVTGEIDEETKEFLEEYLKERRNNFGSQRSLWGRERMEEIRARIQERREEMRERMAQRREEISERMADRQEERNERRSNNEARWDEQISFVSKPIALSAVRDVTKTVRVVERALESFEDDNSYDDGDLEKAEDYLEGAKEHLEKAREYYLESQYPRARFEAGNARVDARFAIRELRNLDKDVVEEVEDEVEEDFDEDEFEEDLEEESEDEEDNADSAGEHDDIVGMTEAEAQKYADDEGVPFRVGYRDGEALAVTMDYRPGRITASIEDGVVIDYTVE